MEQLQVNATLPSISPDAADQFKQLAAEALATVRREPGTLQHDWFFSDDGARCVVARTYASSDAFLAHLAGAGPLLGRLVELGGGLELEVFGEPSAALREPSLPSSRGSTATAKESRRAGRAPDSMPSRANRSIGVLKGGGKAIDRWLMPQQ